MTQKEIEKIIIENLKLDSIEEMEAMLIKDLCDEINLNIGLKGEISRQNRIKALTELQKILDFAPEP